LDGYIGSAAAVCAFDIGPAPRCSETSHSSIDAREGPTPRRRTQEDAMAILDLLRPTPDLRVPVTAGASGVGAAIACAFQEAGSRVTSATSTGQRSIA